MVIVRHFFQLKETAATIIGEEKYIEVAKNGIMESREIIEKFILRDPFFMYTLEPYEYPEDAHPLIKRMCRASQEVNVGPMATVAGSIAQYAVDKMREKGAYYAVIDNGGDIAIHSPKREVKVGIYTGNPYTSRFALLITPEDRIGGVCTSSGKIGPSLSFGNADAVTILADDAVTADAAATASANQIKEVDDIKRAFRIIEDIKGVRGAIAVVGRNIGMWGEIPQIIKGRRMREKITWRWF